MSSDRHHVSAEEEAALLELRFVRAAKADAGGRWPMIVFPRGVLGSARATIEYTSGLLKGEEGDGKKCALSATIATLERIGFLRCFR